MDKHLNGSASPEEEQELFEWYAQFQERKAEPEPISSREADVLLQTIKSKISTEGRQRRNFRLWTGIAASLALVVLSTWLVVRQNDNGLPAKLLSVVTKNNQKQQLSLPDGTLVWLNAGSKLEYPSRFNEGSRELWLSGEGYFEVTHNSGWPFIVHTKNVDVKVLGTVFNLKAYPEDKTETSLLKGAVEVTVNYGSRRKVVLHPFQKLIAADQGGAKGIDEAVQVEQIAGDPVKGFVAETAWTKSAFSFSNETLSVISTKLEKVYGIKIIIQNPAYKELRFTGNFDNAGINTVLNALQFSNEFKYRKEGEETIIIY